MKITAWVLGYLKTSVVHTFELSVGFAWSTSGVSLSIHNSSYENPQHSLTLFLILCCGTLFPKRAHSLPLSLTHKHPLPHSLSLPQFVHIKAGYCFELLRKFCSSGRPSFDAKRRRRRRRRRPRKSFRRKVVEEFHFSQKICGGTFSASARRKTWAIKAALHFHSEKKLRTKFRVPVKIFFKQKKRQKWKIMEQH